MCSSHSDKRYSLARPQDGKKSENSLIAIHVHSPATIKLANKREEEKYFRTIEDLRVNMTKLTEVVVTINDRLDKYQKNANKSWCQSCAIL